jgi:hypothetical protein
MKRNDILAFFVVGALILAGVYVGTSLHSFAPAQIGSSSTNSQGISLSCAGSSSAPTLSLTAYYNNSGTVPPTPTQVATSYSVYTPGVPITKASGTSSSSAATSVSDVNCGGTYLVNWGDNSNYYLTQVSTTVQNTTQAVTTQLLPVSSPTVQFQNGTIADWVNQAKFFGVSNGYKETNLEVRIQAGSGFWGNPVSALLFAYNTTTVSSIYLNLPQLNVPSSAVSIPAGYATVAYQIPQISNYQLEQLNPIITTGTLSSNTLNATAINVDLISEASYNNNGNLESGLFVNPSTRAVLITPVKSTATTTGTGQTFSTGGILIYG